MKKNLKRTITALVFSLALAGAVSAQTGEHVTFSTSDGVVIAGTLWNAGAGKPAVICLHQWRSDRSSYAGLAKLLASNGFTVLTIDARGYGESTATSEGGKVRPDRDIQKDVLGAVEYVKNTAKPGKIALVGASYGSSNAIIFASKSNAVSSLVLLSPGLNYFNVLPTEAPIQKLGNKKVLAVASSEDVRSVEAVNRYVELLGQGLTHKVYDDVGHGTDMLSGEKALASLIKDFLLKTIK